MVAHLTPLLTAVGLKIHCVTGGVKRPRSLADKLRRKPGRYPTLEDVTDLVGVRVITSFERDVNVVARMIEEHFVVDWDNSSDNSKMHDPDRFGSLGVHDVVRAEPDLVPERAGTRYEVQIRFILQHAWTEIEHDLGSRNRETVPREVRRRFSRLAGLLEMADEEFMALHRMTRDCAATLPARIAQNPESVLIDAQLAAALHVPLLSDWSDPERPQRLASLLHYASVHSVGLLQKELARHGADVQRFGVALLPRIRELWKPTGGGGLRQGSSVVQSALLRACANPSLDPSEAVRRLDLGGAGTLDEVVRTVQDVYAAELGGHAAR
ncbi:MAG: GTP pyrophosphokinase family protein [Deinococcota bacterium]